MKGLSEEDYMAKRIGGAIIGCFLGYLVSLAILTDVEPVICVILGGILGFALPLAAIIGTIFFFIIGAGYGRNSRR